ncbi:mitochondrial 37S ribosomal protein uS4m [Colletotrichum truncatum]|uniref:30s ribosomal subunit n=1 Tax=Colletotrichum truncatum TaxID=5467 RepID=A0ACC3YEW4_COLTU|nr:30s ribosomal subunit [Colletotrichum truncatum]KAF6784963.1 30s ribosomal subunit [Colletotrichum truncatum]
MRGRKPRWYSLQNIRIRQSWNKHNLFNLLRKKLVINRFSRTFFQQKWAAKSATRAYHGAHIKETDWSRMFSRRLYSAVDMPPEYLATFDGSEQASGRGSGRAGLTINASSYSRYEKERQRRANEEPTGSRLHPRQADTDSRGKLLSTPINEMTPYMQMAYAPLERRLDVAIFRAMFASSTLQAKQFCTHGAVKVNGKTMRYGAYLLNPGDMFQVDVDHVLYATGRPKTPAHAKYLAGEDWETKNASLSSKKDKSADADAETSEQTAAEAPAEAETEDAEAQAAAEGEGAEAKEELTEEERAAQHKKHLKSLVRSAKDLINDGQGLNPRKKRQLRSFMSEAKRAIAQSGRTAETATVSPDNIMDHLSTLLKDFKLDGSQVEAVAAPEEQSKQEAEQPKPSAKEKANKDTLTELVSSKEVRKAIDGLSKEEQNALASLLRKDAENPIDESKPYWTPWQPRRYMAPFAFIPRYLEVNQNICAAVYLRHPVARRGLAEVPTPFPYETNQLAFNWYLKRR